MNNNSFLTLHGHFFHMAVFCKNKLCSGTQINKYTFVMVLAVFYTIHNLPFDAKRVWHAWLY